MSASLSDLLVNKTLVGIEVSRGEDFLKIVVQSGKKREKVFLRAEGDCCSESWFAEIMGASIARGKTIRSVEYKDLPAPEDNRSRQECDKAYSLVVNTDGGCLDIVYRNSSNGYYGGWCEVITREAALAAKPKWISVEDDWQAW